MSTQSIIEFQEFVSPVKQEKFLLGIIEGYTEVDPASLGIDSVFSPRAIWEVAVDDPYVATRSAEEQMEVHAAEVGADNYARKRREMGYWERKPDTAYVTEEGQEAHKDAWGDPESRERFFSSLNNKAISLWQEQVIPSAKALAYLSDPNAFEVVESLDGAQQEEMDEATRKWFSLCTDAVGIRSRATILSEAVKNYIDITVEEGSNPNELRWMSIACGTALPTIKAAVSAKVSPKMHLVDWNVDAMNDAYSLAEELDFKGEMKQHRANIFEPRHMSLLKQKLESSGDLPDVIDMMGIFEYAGENINIDPAVFLRSCYDFLKPGGRLIFGQMRSDRPLPDFTMGVVSWPFIHMRSPSEIMNVVRDAGILPEQARLFLPKDDVYAVGVIDKPSLDSKIIPTS
ncbi:MAG: hypothetical protein ABIR37_04350 [Candidatus Saccharimonadales bacterium]